MAKDSQCPPKGFDTIQAGGNDCSISACWSPSEGVPYGRKRSAFARAYTNPHCLCEIGIFLDVSWTHVFERMPTTFKKGSVVCGLFSGKVELGEAVQDSVRQPIISSGNWCGSLGCSRCCSSLWQMEANQLMNVTSEQLLHSGGSAWIYSFDYRQTSCLYRFIWD